MNISFYYLFIYSFFFDCAGSSLIVVVSGLFLVEVSRGYSSFLCKGFSLQWLLCFTGSRVCRLQELQYTGLVVALHGPSRPTA